MFPLILRLSLGYAPLAEYSLSAPFALTNVSEIGNWSLRGSAVSWKNRIRLTSESQLPEWGAACQRAPFVSTDWTIDLDVSARGSDAGGLGITFLYSDSVCPRRPDRFRGFQLTLNTSAQSLERADETPVYFSEGSFLSAQKVAAIKFRNQNFPTKVQITKSHSVLWVRYTTFTRYIPLFRVNLTTEMPPFGYFTIFAETAADQSDNNDLYSVRAEAESDVQWSHISQGLLSDNRKMLESDAAKRREAKQARRSALLPTMHGYLQAAAAQGQRLPERAADMRDAFALVAEAANRGMEAVTIDMLKVFINRYLQDTLAGAGKKVNLATERFDESRAEIADMWAYLRAQLIGLATDARAALARIAEDAVITAREIRIEKVLEQPPDSGGDAVTKTLVLICVVELVAYLAFFARQHAKTQGFKKVD
jgi:hypothetical protein